MSEEFDKEAEREKLREQLEADEEKRKETQRMSELLLQGATMTNEHCDNCGDPLFRDGGETFCPTCGGGADAEAAQNAAEQQAGQSQQSQQPTGGAEPAANGEQGAEVEQSLPTPPATARQTVDAQPGQAAPTNGAEPAAEDPRAELQRAVSRCARKANEATDPRTAKQWLEASKEAAEALEALER